jgi:hypothetical protein
MESGNRNRALVSGDGGSVPEQSSGDAIGARCTLGEGEGEESERMCCYE